MNGRTRSGLLVAVAGALVASACTSTHYTRIRHPLHVGQVDPNTVPFQDHDDADARGLPDGVLTDEAALTEVTPERICAHTTLWSLDEVDATRGDYQSYDISLLNDQSDVENTDAEISLEQPTTQQYQGHIARQVLTGYRQVCAAYTQQNQCARYEQQPVYSTVYEPHVWQVTNHPATLCFPNGGFVTPSTTRVALELDAVGPFSRVFEWQFDSAVTQTAPRPAQGQASQPQAQ